MAHYLTLAIGSDTRTSACLSDPNHAAFTNIPGSLISAASNQILTLLLHVKEDHANPCGRNIGLYHRRLLSVTQPQVLDLCAQTKMDRLSRRFRSPSRGCDPAPDLAWAARGYVTFRLSTWEAASGKLPRET